MSNLRTVLRINAATSLPTGLLALVAAPWVGDGIGVESTLLIRLVGAGLVVFAVDVLLVAASDRVTTLAKLVSAADLAWVAGTLVLVAAGAFSTLGAALMLAVAAVVGTLGITQLRLSRTTEPSTLTV